VFYTNSGSEAVDTALKIAIGYHRLRGEGTRTRFIGRERSYHGVNIAGISVGGVPSNRKAYSGTLLPNVDYLRHTHGFSENLFSRGQPAKGAELANELEERLIALHDASNIAAVIVEPFAGSAGVVIPPVGYLQRLRELCTAHNILLIFDEVITGFGRAGALTGAQAFGVTPDIMNVAKQVTNGVQPLGAVIAKQEIYDTFMATGGPEYMLEFTHGYTGNYMQDGPRDAVFSAPAAVPRPSPLRFSYFRRRRPGRRPCPRSWCGPTRAIRCSMPSAHACAESTKPFRWRSRPTGRRSWPC